VRSRRLLGEPTAPIDEDKPSVVDFFAWQEPNADRDVGRCDGKRPPTERFPLTQRRHAHYEPVILLARDARASAVGLFLFSHANDLAISRLARYRLSDSVARRPQGLGTVGPTEFDKLVRRGLLGGEHLLLGPRRKDRPAHTTTRAGQESLNRRCR
jgi:hypothetical protein